MKTSEHIACEESSCADIRHDSYVIPDIEVVPDKVSIVMISETPPADRGDYYYAGADSLFAKTTIQAFNDAGAEVSSVQNILDLGVYLTTAVKCGKTEYGTKAGTIKQCSLILEKELTLFPNVKVFMLMGDVAIKAVNEIARRNGKRRVIPAGSTYKIRGQEYYFRGARAFPSYLQAGPTFFIEKSKRRMIAEDIASALALGGKSL
jgi:uracil-DNA glycosylase